MRKKEVFQKIDLHKTNDIMFAFDNALYDTACLVDDMNIFQGTNIEQNKKIQNNKKTVNKDQIENSSNGKAQKEIKEHNNKKIQPNTSKKIIPSSQHGLSNNTVKLFNHPNTKNNKQKGILVKK